MLRNLIVLPDGTELFSGTNEKNAIENVKLTQSVNSENELTLGSVCSSMLEAKIITPSGGLNIAAGTEVTLYNVNDAGARTKIGLFTLEKPTRPSANTYRITAFDRVSWLDKDLTEWIAGLDAWPYRMDTFAQMVCEACGLTWSRSTFPNSNYEIQQFTADEITGRQLMKWIGESCARFCRATADGNIEFAWYSTTNKKILPTGDLYFFSGSLSYEDYETETIGKVQIRLTGDDVGVVYPQNEDAANTYTITSNYLLTTTDTENLELVAQNIYEAIRNVRYTPCSVKIPSESGIKAGDIVQITDINGNTITTYVMSRTQSGQSDVLTSTGSVRRDSSTVVNNTTLGAMKSKMMEIKKSVDGLSVKASDLETKVQNNQKETAEKIAELEIKSDSISASVTETQTTIVTTTENIYDEINGLRQESVTQEQLEEVKSTVLELSADNVEMRFTQVSNLIDEMGVTVEEKQRILEQYIRFEGARMELGRSDSQIQAVLKNDRLSFIENGMEVAYISNAMLYVTDIHVLNRIRQGNTNVGYYDLEIGETGTRDLVWSEV